MNFMMQTVSVVELYMADADDPDTEYDEIEPTVEPGPTPDRRWVPAERQKEKIDNLSPIVSYCVARAMDLARDLNHAETTTAHFVVALTLFPESTEWFRRRGFDAQIAWRASMCAIIDLKRMSAPSDVRPAPSNELKLIVHKAQAIGQGRENQDAVMDDVILIFREMAPSELAKQLVTGLKSSSTTDEILEKLRSVESRMNSGFDALEILAKETLKQAQDDQKNVRKGPLANMFRRA